MPIPYDGIVQDTDEYDEFVRTPEAERIWDALDLHDFGVQLYRQRMRRENPDAGEAEIDALVRDWLIAPPRPDRVRLMPRKREHGNAR